MELDEMMKDCLIRANRDFPDLDYIDTVMEAFRDYVLIMGAPVQIEDEEEGEALLQKAVYFLVDCVVIDMIGKGIIEVDSIDEDGDLMYKMSAEF